MGSMQIPEEPLSASSREVRAPGSLSSTMSCCILVECCKWGAIAQWRSERHITLGLDKDTPVQVLSSPLLAN